MLFNRRKKEIEEPKEIQKKPQKLASIVEMEEPAVMFPEESEEDRKL